MQAAARRRTTQELSADDRPALRRRDRRRSTKYKDADRIANGYVLYTALTPADTSSAVAVGRRSGRAAVQGRGAGVAVGPPMTEDFTMSDVAEPEEHREGASVPSVACSGSAAPPPAGWWSAVSPARRSPRRPRIRHDGRPLARSMCRSTAPTRPASPRRPRTGCCSPPSTSPRPTAPTWSRCFKDWTAAAERLAGGAPVGPTSPSRLAPPTTRARRPGCSAVATSRSPSASGRPCSTAAGSTASGWRRSGPAALVDLPAFPRRQPRPRPQRAATCACRRAATTRRCCSTPSAT